MAVPGNWTLFYDWGCNGRYSKADMTVNPDGTWTNSEGSSGLWTQTTLTNPDGTTSPQDAGMFVFTFDDLETTYSGNLASQSITGTSTSFNGFNGCFYMLQEGVPTEFAAERVAGQRDAAGNE